jgi:NAD+ synthase
MAARSDVKTATEPLDLRFTDDELEAEHERILSFIEDHVMDEIGRMGHTIEYDTAVIGLSGGIDSTLVTYLAVEALGSENVYGLVMPSEASGDETMSDAERIAEELGIDYDTVAIDPLVEAITDAAPDRSDDERDEFHGMVGLLQRTITSVRIRSLLEQLSAMTTSGVLVGASNRSEWLTGHFDKYGDAAVDCQPLLHLYKQQVRQLATHVGVPDRIAERAASPDVDALGTDEENLGVDYDTADSVLALTVEGPVSPGRTAERLGIDEDVVERLLDLYEQSRSERSFAPSLLPSDD